MGHETKVLKFGSSVLRTDTDVALVVTEIYRHWRAGSRVVAVISAFRERTNELLARAKRIGGDGPSLGALLGVGEAESSAAVALGLEQAGLPTHLVSPGRTGIIAEGDITESEPVGTNPEDIEIIRQALCHGSIVVVPGYVARSTENVSVVLGRGGSDLTAVCLADALGTEATLLKDSGAVYEWDPAEGVFAPKPFDTLSFGDALALGDRVLQPRAIEYARRVGTRLTVTGFGGAKGTLVGTEATRLRELQHGISPVRVAVLGLGSVGGGVVQRLAREPGRVELVGALVRHIDQERSDLPLSVPVFDQAEQIWDTHPDIIIEAIGGTDAALHLTRAALARGVDVVTANKAMLATYGSELLQLADTHGRSIRGSAAVGGALPVLELIEATASHGRVVRVRGVLNGTANFVLNQLRAGRILEEALDEARSLGYAEQDAISDLAGIDAANKLVCIAQQLGIHDLHLKNIRRDIIDASFAARINSRVFRQIAELVITSTGPAASVRLVDVPSGDPLHELPGVRNAIVATSADGTEIVRSADGAGRWPTTESIVADVFAITSERRAGTASYDRHFSVTTRTDSR